MLEFAFIFRGKYLSLISNFLDIADDCFHTIETEAVTFVTSGVISIYAVLDNDNRFQKKHMRVCGMFRHFFMLWELDLATDTHDNLDK